MAKRKRNNLSQINKAKAAAMSEEDIGGSRNGAKKRKRNFSSFFKYSPRFCQAHIMWRKLLLRNEIWVFVFALSNTQYHREGSGPAA